MTSDQQRLEEARIRHSRAFEAEDIPVAISGHEAGLLEAVRLRDDARAGRLLRHAIGEYVRRCAKQEIQT